VKLTLGAAVSNCEGVYHARLQRLGTEGQRRIPLRSFGSARNSSLGIKKLVEMP
jgi:hypothetical protein